VLTPAGIGATAACSHKEALRKGRKVHPRKAWVAVKPLTRCQRDKERWSKGLGAGPKKGDAVGKQGTKRRGDKGRVPWNPKQGGKSTDIGVGHKKTGGVRGSAVGRSRKSRDLWGGHRDDKGKRANPAQPTTQNAMPVQRRRREERRNLDFKLKISSKNGTQAWGPKSVRIEGGPPVGGTIKCARLCCERTSPWERKRKRTR